MRSVCLALLVALAAQTARAHPHPGGIVGRPDETVVVGDILGRRLLVIDPNGKLREVAGVGDVRGLAGHADGTLYGVSWGQRGGIWKLGDDDRPVSVRDGFNGLLTAGDQGALLLAPVDSHGRGQQLEVRSPNGQRSALTKLSDITAIAWHDGTALAACGAAVYSVNAEGDVENLVDDVGAGLYGLAMGPNGLIVAAFDQRQVVELAPDGTRRVLLTSEAPWGPVDLAVADGALYVVELVEHPCCWKGPRVRRLVAGQMPTTLLTIDDGRHLHISPGERPFAWLMGVSALVGIAMARGVSKVARRRQRAAFSSLGPA